MLRAVEKIRYTESGQSGSPKKVWMLKNRVFGGKGKGGGGKKSPLFKRGLLVKLFVEF